MKKRILLLIVMVTMVGTLCACEKQNTGIVKMTGGKEQTAGEKEKVSDQNADQTVEHNDVAQLPKNEENVVEMQPIENGYYFRADLECFLCGLELYSDTCNTSD